MAPSPKGSTFKFSSHGCFPFHQTMGSTISVLKQMWPPESKITVDDIPDLSGKVVVVTGGNTGIGYQTAKVRASFITSRVCLAYVSSFKALVQHNAKVYIACRSASKANEAIARLEKECDGKTALFHPLDLADLAAVKASALSFLKCVHFKISTSSPRLTNEFQQGARITRAVQQRVRLGGNAGNAGTR